MSITGLEDISFSKEEVKENREGGSVNTTKTLIFKHEATAGQLVISSLALTTPTEAAANGFVQPSGGELASLNLLVNKKNIKIHSSRGVWLQMYEDYVVTGINSITLIGNIADLGGALVGEIFTVYATPVQANSILVADSKKMYQEYVLPVGQTVLNLGREYEVNKNPSSQIGALRVFRNGVGPQLRNVGNVDADPLADGNFEEIDAGFGVGTTIEFNSAPVGQDDVIVVEFGLEFAGDLSIYGDMQALYGAFNKLIGDAAPAFGWPESRYLSFAPSEIERRGFGDQVIALQNTVIDLQSKLYAPGTVRRVELVRNTANTTLSNSMGASNSIPVITQGTEIFNFDYTPLKPGNRLLIEVQVSGAETANSSDDFSAALFIDNATNAVAAGSDSTLQTIAGFLQEGNIAFATTVIAAGTTNIKVRAGMNAGSGTLNILIAGASNASYNFGGTLGSYVKVTELHT